MYYTYVLQSVKNGDIYIGSSENVTDRLREHNQGRVKSTKPYRPWKLLKYYEYPSRNEAMRQEKFLKTHQQKEKIKQEFGLVAKW